MKKIHPILVLAAFIIPLGLIIAAVPENTTRQYKLTAKELLEEAVTGTQFISTDEIAELLVNKDPELLLIDVRSQAEYEQYHLEGAINIPLVDILSDEWIDVVNQSVMRNVFYSNGTRDANEAWLITRQLGYENNYVMQGGMNYWAETIMNPKKPASTSPDEEIAKYDFRKAAGGALGVGGGEMKVEAPVQTKSKLPKIKVKKKKKRAEGGC